MPRKTTIFVLVHVTRTIVSMDPTPADRAFLPTAFSAVTFVCHAQGEYARTMPPSYVHSINSLEYCINNTLSHIATLLRDINELGVYAIDYESAHICYTQLSANVRRYFLSR